MNNDDINLGDVREEGTKLGIITLEASGWRCMLDIEKHQLEINRLQQQVQQIHQQIVQLKNTAGTV